MTKALFPEDNKLSNWFGSICSTLIPMYYNSIKWTLKMPVVIKTIH